MFRQYGCKKTRVEIVKLASLNAPLGVPVGLLAQRELRE